MDLTNDKEYTITLLAENEVGEGPSTELLGDAEYGDSAEQRRRTWWRSRGTRRSKLTWEKLGIGQAVLR